MFWVPYGKGKFINNGFGGFLDYLKKMKWKKNLISAIFGMALKWEFKDFFDVMVFDIIIYYDTEQRKFFWWNKALDMLLSMIELRIFCFLKLIHEKFAKRFNNKSYFTMFLYYYLSSNKLF